jgi:hypothetical protein
MYGVIRKVSSDDSLIWEIKYGKCLLLSLYAFYFLLIQKNQFFFIYI